MSIKDHKWSDEDLQVITVPTKDYVWIYSNYAESDSSLNRDDVKALAAHFELDDDHKAALAEKEAELEKARELLKAVLDMIKHMNTSPAHAASWAEPNDNALTIGIEDITAYLGDKA